MESPGERRETTGGGVVESGHSSARATLRKLVGSVSIYTVALFAPRLVRLVTIPLVTHAISLRVYGTYAALWLLMPFVHTICDMGLGTAALRLAAEVESKQRRQALFSTLVVARAAGVALVALLMVLFKERISQLLTGTREHASMVVLMALALVPGTVWDSFAEHLRSEERHRTLAAIIISRTLLSNALTVLLVVGLHYGLAGLMSARLVTEAILFVVTAWICRQILRQRPDWQVLKRLVVLGAPLGLLYLLGTLRDFDRYLIQLLSGVEEVGSYDLATRIVAPVALANVALAMVLEPHLFKTHGSPRANEAIELFLRGYVAVFSFGAAAISMLVPEIFAVLVPESYHEAARAAPLLLFAFVADGVLRISGLGGDLAKRTRLWAIVAIVNLAVSLPVTLLLVPLWGITGAGLGLLAGTMTAALASRALSGRVHRLKLPVLRSLAILATGAAISCAMLGGATGSAVALPLRAIAILPLGLAAWLASGIEIAAVRKLLQ